MSSSKAILKTLRLPNLIMLAVVQFIVSHYMVIEYVFSFYLLITASTISIALGGYLLNDIQDLAIDKHNGKLGLISTENKREASIIAIVFHLLGLALGFYACSLSSMSFFPCFIAASIALVAYAFLLSKYKFIGNLVISSLIVLAIFLTYLLEANHHATDSEFDFVGFIALSYALLGFLLNWIREICKDIEDIEGDKLFNRYSLPIIFGIGRSKVLIGFVILGFIGIIGCIANNQESFSFPQFYLIMYTFLLFGSLVLLFLSKSIQDFKRLSIALKILMIIGLMLPTIGIFSL